MKKKYCVVYLSPGGMHYRYRCTANNKRSAKKMCREALGVSSADIIEVYEEE